MFALKAAKRARVMKRTPVLMLPLLVLLAAPAALAGGDGYLGVMLQDISPSMAKALQLGEREGVLVNEVVEDGPAAKAGLSEGDVILSFKGDTVADYGDLVDAVGDADPGDKAELVVLRNGKEKKIAVEIGERDDEVAFFGDGDGRFHGRKLKNLSRKMKDMRWFGDGDHKVMIAPDDDHTNVWIGDHDDVIGALFNSDRGFMGVRLDDLNDQLGDYFGVKDGAGALVTSVNEDSPAAEAGLKAGDVIVAVGDEDIDSPDALHRVMSDTEPGQEVAVKVVRKGSGKSFKVTLAEMPESDIAFFDDGEFPRSFSFHTPNVQVFGDPDDDDDTKIRQLYRFRGDDDELDDMREELDQLRKELKEMREELKK